MFGANWNSRKLLCKLASHKVGMHKNYAQLMDIRILAFDFRYGMTGPSLMISLKN